MENPLSEHVERIKAINDPVERALAVSDLDSAVVEARQELRTIRRAAVLELRDAGWSYGQISNALGLHRNRVQQIAEGRSR